MYLSPLCHTESNVPVLCRVTSVLRMLVAADGGSGHDEGTSEHFPDIVFKLAYAYTVHTAIFKY